MFAFSLLGLESPEWQAITLAHAQFSHYSHTWTLFAKGLRVLRRLCHSRRVARLAKRGWSRRHWAREK